MGTAAYRPGADAAAEDKPPPGAVAVRNGFGNRGCDGPMPPVGDEPHRYFFTLFALDRRLDVEPDASLEQLRQALAQHALASGTLVGRYAR